MNLLKMVGVIICVCLCTFHTLAQPVPPGIPDVVITEIMYNPPESGSDSLEFIEIRNPSPTNERSLSGYYFSDGIDFTFPIGYLIDPLEYVLIAKDSVVFESAFNTMAFQWDNSSLLNTGEAVVIKSNLNETVDSVNYGIMTPWPSEANGGGTSIVLCNDTIDNNDPNNWTAATTEAGFMVEGLTIFANPNAGCDGLTGVEEDENRHLSIYPNPSSGNFRVQSLSDVGAGWFSLEVYRLNGTLVLQEHVRFTSDNVVPINLNVDAGIYLMRLVGSTSVFQQRLVVLD